MTNPTTSTTLAKPAFWYGVPHGYLSMDLAPSVESLEGLLEQIRALPGELRDDAEQVLRFYAGFITSMNKQHVQACLVGMHPDDSGSAAMSVLTVSMVSTNGANAELAVADMAGVGATDRPEEGIVPLELPCGAGFLAAKRQRTAAPGGASKESDAPPKGTVWQGTVAVADANRSSVIMLQLVTPAVDQAENYRNILVGVAHTITFTDPYATESGTAEALISGSEGRAAEAIRNDFG